MGITIPEFSTEEEKLIRIVSAIDEKNPRAWIRDEIRKVLEIRSKEMPGMEYKYVPYPEILEIWELPPATNQLKTIFSDGKPKKYRELAGLIMDVFGVPQRKMRVALSYWLKSGMVIKDGDDRDPTSVYKLGIL